MCEYVLTDLNPYSPFSKPNADIAATLETWQALFSTGASAGTIQGIRMNQRGMPASGSRMIGLIDGLVSQCFGINTARGNRG